MTPRHHGAQVSFHGMADRLTALKLRLHAVRRRLQCGEVPESAVTAHLTRLDREVDASAADSSYSCRESRPATCRALW